VANSSSAANLGRRANPQGFVEISRARGRIAGWAKPRIPVKILWCGTNRPRKKHGQRRNGWSFPPAVRELLLQECKGLTVVHLFGGRADFGVRLDIDPATKPDVLGDAYLPPFPRDSFDVVILDPPYTQVHQHEKIALLRAAAWIARRRVIWFHTVWIEGDRRIKIEKAWLVACGTQCSVRCLQFFAVHEPKLPPVRKFTRGPAIRYNRWLVGNAVLPFAQSPVPQAVTNYLDRTNPDFPAARSAVHHPRAGADFLTGLSTRDATGIRLERAAEHSGSGEMLRAEEETGPFLSAEGGRRGA